ncbi:MAG: glycoside hydrolase family 3 protein [Chloroflexi bacterium]|nr:glycoside hydrolase family 3 protein [Chloroflexota bacterium]NOG62077.1 glycoside hydrolase family 3 protein [Chloroflexota bacterium]
MMRQISKYLLMSMLLLAFVSSPFTNITKHPTQHTAYADDSIEQRVDELIRKMTLEQKVGQMFMVSIYGTRMSDPNERFLRQYQPGAIALFGSNLDYQSTTETTDYINVLQQIVIESSGIPMLVAVDQEGGRVWRLVNGFTHFPEPLYLGAAADPNIAYAVGQALGREIKGVGVNMNLAPVVDLTTRFDNLTPTSVLFQRTMGEDPVVVGELSGMLARGMADAGVIGVVKHFPGHSPTRTDSHTDLAVVDIDRQTFEERNLRAFRLAIEYGAEVVMVGHLYYPAIEPVENLPASLSPTMMGILRHDLGFDGVIMTDALGMGAILNHHNAEDAALLAIDAGADILAMGPNMAFAKQKSSMEAVVTAVNSGELSEGRIDESVRRILLLKARHHLLDWEPLDSSDPATRIQQELTSPVMTQAFESAVTVLQDKNGLLPLRPTDNVALIFPAIYNDIGKTCSQYLPDAEILGYTYFVADWEYVSTRKLGESADKIIIFVETLYVNTEQAALIERLPPEKTVVVSLATPYDWEFIKPEFRPSGYVAAYANIPEAQQAVCRVLAGVVPTRGMLPLTMTDFNIGSGLVYDAQPISTASNPTPQGDMVITPTP